VKLPPNAVSVESVLRHVDAVACRLAGYALDQPFSHPWIGCQPGRDVSPFHAPIPGPAEGEPDVTPVAPELIE
jgi:hypothetical protein